MGAWLEFTNKDVYKNIDMHRDTVKRVDDLDSRKDKIALGVTKRVGSRGSNLNATFNEGMHPS
jgi:hypothetical protein